MNYNILLQVLCIIKVSLNKHLKVNFVTLDGANSYSIVYANIKSKYKNFWTLRTTVGLFNNTIAGIAMGMVVVGLVNTGMAASLTVLVKSVVITALGTR